MPVDNYYLCFLMLRAKAIMVEQSHGGLTAQGNPMKKF